MTLNRFSLSDITQSRFDYWAKELADHNATPLMLVGLGHEENSGELHLFTMQGVEDEDLERFLAFALAEIRLRRRSVA